MDAANVRRGFRTAIKNAEGVNPKEWTPRELRHSFVSLLSDKGLPLEEISRLVGHKSTAVTEIVRLPQADPSRSPARSHRHGRDLQGQLGALVTHLDTQKIKKAASRLGSGL
ncbi:tyrosine-type recombinase/integrase [Nonomuraea sp. NPDC049709]|uniref:tyrosine-type recombinase/integrase n=1 Tax=Nonomuraea sp. NPDC049709 TaxID=3154736 RepID=UPI00341A0640